ncbi:MAG: hypothetical protein JWP01_3986 [Myxococcales bacterium]|nr:hypothetical protein [Myxococcales bacterium]
MRLVALAAIAALATPAHADGFDLSRKAHLATSYGITLSVATIAQRFGAARWQGVVLGAALVALAGTTKELIDPEYSWGDQLANAAGVTTATVLVFSFQL